MSSHITKSKQELKLFNTLSNPQPSPSQTSKNQTTDQQQGTSKWGLFFAATHNLSLPIERLLLKTLNAELGVPGCIVDPYAIAFRNCLLPSWRYKLAVGLLASNYKKIVESSVVGVPGMLTYLDARTRWVDGHIRSAVQDGFQQVVILGGGFDTRALRLGATFPSLNFFEVDSAQILNRKKALIAELPEELANKKSQITFVHMDWTNPSALIPALTAAGFQPTLKTVIMMEGLLPHLDATQASTILADAAALCPPGSKLLFDFLHFDAFDGSNRLYTGYSTLASALANKGAPFKSGHAIGFSDWVRATQRIHLRIGEVISPQNIALHLVRPEYEASAAAAGGGSGSGSTSSDPSEQAWCSVGCLAPLSRAGHSAGNNTNPDAASESALIPMSIALPQFYSLVSAIKIVPRINLKDAAPPLHLTGLLNGPATGAVRRTVSSFETISAPVTSCFFKGILSMIWGNDTDDEGEEQPRPLSPAPRGAQAIGAAAGDHLPVSFSSSAAAPRQPTERSGTPEYSSYFLETQKSADWSLIASRGGHGEHENCSHGRGAPLDQQQLVNSSSGADSSSFSGLDHAISIPALQKYDDKGEVVDNDTKDDGSGGGGGGSGWWTSWFG